tara:strand:- start:1335 stop:1475 length:141 start_codon:yes stop_codon:yes gene_type:complete
MRELMIIIIKSFKQNFLIANKQANGKEIKHEKKIAVNETYNDNDII